MRTETPSVVVEFFGIPRHRAGRETMHVSACTVAEMLDAVEQACPNLRGVLRDNDRVAPHVLLSIDGIRFVSDLKKSLADGARVLILSADAGG